MERILINQFQLNTLLIFGFASYLFFMKYILKEAEFEDENHLDTHVPIRSLKIYRNQFSLIAVMAVLGHGPTDPVPA